MYVFAEKSLKKVVEVDKAKIAIPTYAGYVTEQGALTDVPSYEGEQVNVDGGMFTPVYNNIFSWLYPITNYDGSVSVVSCSPIWRKCHIKEEGYAIVKGSEVSFNIDINLYDVFSVTPNRVVEFNSRFNVETDIHAEYMVYLSTDTVTRFEVVPYSTEYDTEVLDVKKMLKAINATYKRGTDGEGTHIFSRPISARIVGREALSSYKELNKFASVLGEAKIVELNFWTNNTPKLLESYTIQYARRIVDKYTLLEKAGKKISARLNATYNLALNTLKGIAY